MLPLIRVVLVLWAEQDRALPVEGGSEPPAKGRDIPTAGKSKFEELVVVVRLAGWGLPPGF